MFDFEAKAIYNIRVRTTDQSGLFFEQALTINVVDVQEDITLPQSAVQPLPQRATSLSIPISVLGSDPLGPGGAAASGVKEYDLYVAIDTGAFNKFATIPASNPIRFILPPAITRTSSVAWPAISLATSRLNLRTFPMQRSVSMTWIPQRPKSSRQ